MKNIPVYRKQAESGSDDSRAAQDFLDAEIPPTPTYKNDNPNRVTSNMRSVTSPKSPRGGSSRERNPLQGASLMNSPLNERYPPKVEIADLIERSIKERERFGSVTYKVDKDKAKTIQPEP